MKRLSCNVDESTRFIISSPVDSIHFSDGSSTLLLKDGTSILGACINCEKKPCVNYGDDELSTPSFSAFPHNTSKRVCPTEAIHISPDTGKAEITDDLCIRCGLCLHRCPTAAIQHSISKNTCFVNTSEENLEKSDCDSQGEFIVAINRVARETDYQSIPASFCRLYVLALSSMAKKKNDLSEIVVRNSLINLGIKCNVTAAGNNHMRTEFFGEDDNLYLFGESDIENTDTLAIPRRILDDYAVLTARHGIDHEKVLVLSVINGLPNKRTDYYEVVYDINNILNVQIRTITYHLLFVLNLLNKRISISSLGPFVIDKNNLSLLDAMRTLVPQIESLDRNIATFNYLPEK